MKIPYSLLASFLLFLLSSACAQPRTSICIENPLGSDRSEVVAVKCSDLGALASAPALKITDADGAAVAYQTTHDGLLLFMASVPALSSAKYYVEAADSAPAAADTISCGANYPFRQDDLAWENDLVAFRAYGPGTTAKGEKMYGYDLFLKRGTDKPVLPMLYHEQFSDENWAQIRALRADGHKAEADSLEKAISYHIDHGFGMDCYAVGATLGAGAAAPVGPDGEIAFQQCFEKAEIIDNGPLRFTARLSFAPLAVGGDTITETRIITLDRGERLNRTVASYAFSADSLTIFAGMPLRGGNKPLNSGACIWAIDPTQGPDNGTLMLGCVFPEAGVEITDSIGSPTHAGGKAILTKAAPELTYYWGYGWDRAGVSCLTEWGKQLNALGARLRHPLSVTVENAPSQL